MKKIFYLFCAVALCFLVTGCGSTASDTNVEGSLSEIIDKLYEGIEEDQKPMGLSNITLNEENFEYYTFANDVKYKEAIASESMTGSIAHSVVLIRLEDAADASKVVEEIDKNADTRKWICVEAEHKYVLSKGDLVVLIMSGDLASTIKENFENLK